MNATSAPGRGRSRTACDRLHDAERRAAKADKILAILHDALGPDLSAMRAVDVGCASGLITAALAPHVRWIVGVEYDVAELAQAERGGSPRPLLVRGDAAALPLADGAVDLAICAQVYEHVADAEALAAEVYRVLAPGGVCFFSGPNRWDPLERHYGLLFLSWLPRAVAHAYVCAAGRGERYTERPRSWWGLKRLWRGFTLQDYTVAAIRDPLRFQVADELGPLAWVGRAPLWVLRALLPLYPNYNWVLRKPGEGPP